jgi:mannonate dehydratase
MMASPKMRVAVGQYPVVTKEYLDYALALGCEGVSFNVPEIPGSTKWDEKDIREFIKPVLAAGLTVESFENVPNHFYDKAMLGLPGRDEQIENMRHTIKSMGAAGVKILGMHWMPQIVWRTDLNHSGRGNSYVSIYDHSIVEDRSRDSEIWVARRDLRDPNIKDTFTRGNFVPLGVDSLSVEQMWENFEYFVKGVITACEEAGVILCFHPDDPPAQELHGIGRILTSVDNLDRAVHIVDSPNLKLELCLGTVSEMGGEKTVMDAVNRFAPIDKIAYIHLRDVQGTFPVFAECFLGEGNYKPYEVVKALHKHGFTGAILDDHTPGLTGDDPYGYRGRAHAIGYIQALIEVVTNN